MQSPQNTRNHQRAWANFITVSCTYYTVGNEYLIFHYCTSKHGVFAAALCLTYVRRKRISAFNICDILSEITCSLYDNLFIYLFFCQIKFFGLLWYWVLIVREFYYFHIYRWDILVWNFFGKNKILIFLKSVRAILFVAIRHMFAFSARTNLREIIHLYLYQETHSVVLSFAKNKMQLPFLCTHRTRVIRNVRRQVNILWGKL